MGPSHRWGYLIERETGSNDKVICPSHLFCDNSATFCNINFVIICRSCRVNAIWQVVAVGVVIKGLV